MLQDSLQKQPRDDVKQSRRWIVKLGSALLTANGLGLDHKAIAEWARQIACLRNQGIDIIVVSSGAIAAGMVRLGWQERPSTVHELQAAAAVGQADLVKTYEQAFAKHDLHAAQILLDHDDFSDRTRYLNARSTLKTLLDLNVIPVVNENDTVVTDEIRFGDNDSLAALVANVVEADYLVILTDQLGMYDSDPRTNPDAVMLNNVSATDPSLVAMAGGGGRLGRGGMATKVKAAKIAARAGAHTLIVGGSIDEVLLKFYRGETVGSLLLANNQPQAARKQWLAGHLQVKGELTIDNGAARFLRDSGKSLLSVGVTRVKGDFNRGDMVVCRNLVGCEVARGIVNYSALETEKIIGQPSREIEKLLGYKDEDELIHRDNLVLSEG